MDIRHALAALIGVVLAGNSRAGEDLEGGPDGLGGVPLGGIRYLRQKGLGLEEIWRVLDLAGRSGRLPQEVLRSRGWRRGRPSR
jgi:hypothetical protein